LGFLLIRVKRRVKMSATNPDLFIENAATYNGQTAWGDGTFRDMIIELLPIVIQLIPMCFPLKEMREAAIVSVRDLTGRQRRQMAATALQGASDIVHRRFGGSLGFFERRRKIIALSEAVQNCLLYQCETASDEVLGGVFDAVVTA